MLLPSFIDIQTWLSPGVISTLLTVCWTLFTGLMTFTLSNQGYLSFHLESNDRVSLYEHHLTLTAISNIRWLDMVLRLAPGKPLRVRTLLVMMLWIIVFGLKILFSLSIDSVMSSTDPTIKCMGAINDSLVMTRDNWIYMAGNEYLTSNLTQSKMLLNRKRFNNIAMLGDGMFMAMDPKAIANDGQTLKANRFHLNCTDVPFNGEFGSSINRNWLDTEINTTSFGTVILKHPISSQNADIAILNTTLYNGVSQDAVWLVMANNPYLTITGSDINRINFNQTGFVYECRLEYQIVTVTSSTQPGTNHTRFAYEGLYDNRTSLLFEHRGLPSIMFYLLHDVDFLTYYDFPDDLMSAYYNQTINTTMSYVNDIIASHFLSAIDTNMDLCMMTTDTGYTSEAIIVTQVSLGYLIVSLAVVVLLFVALFIYSIFAPTTNIYTTTYGLVYNIIYPDTLVKVKEEDLLHVLSQQPQQHPLKKDIE